MLRAHRPAICSSWALLEGFDFVSPSWPELRTVMHAVALILVLISAGARTAAHAEGKLDARYSVSLAGIPVGKAAWALDIGDDQYTAAASGSTTGLLRVFASGQGTSAARGITKNGQTISGTYASTISADKKTDEVRMLINGGTVKEYVADPPATYSPDRIPVTDAHKRDVTDPMTASLIRVAGNADPLGPEACQRSTAIFDGRMRYDLQFAYKRMDKVKAEKGYQGPVVVCAIYFAPVAGFIPDRSAIKYLVAQRDMEMWLAPVAGTRVLVPFRISVPTPIGLAVLEATQFVSTIRSTAANVK
jgi:hypothetical protein